MQGNNSSITKINKIGIILVGMLIVIGIVAFFAKSKFGNKPAPTATISFTYPGLPDENGLNVQFNNQTGDLTSPDNYRVPPGSITINVTKPGYQTFTTKLVAIANKTYTVNAQLQPGTPPPDINSLQQLNGTNLSLPDGASIATVTYYYSNTWAVILASAGGSNAAIVAKYDLAAQQWDAILGPGTSFTQSDLQQVPPQVASYLTSNNYVE